MKLINSIKDLREDNIYFLYYPKRRQFLQHISFFKRECDEEDYFTSLLCYALDFDSHYSLTIADWHFSLGVSERELFKYGCVFELTIDEIMLHFGIDEI